MKRINGLYGQIDAIGRSLSLLQAPVPCKELERASQKVWKVVARCPPEHRYGLSLAAHLALAVTYIDEAPKIERAGRPGQGERNSVKCRKPERIPVPVLARAVRSVNAAAPRQIFLARASITEACSPASRVDASTQSASPRR